MPFSQILSRFADQPWLIRPENFETVAAIVQRRTSGMRLDAEALAEFRAQTEARRKPQISRAVAILPLLGVIAKRMDMMMDISGGTSSDRFGRDFDQAMADPEVGAVLIDIDSPGGEHFGTPELAEKIFRARGQKPIAAIANPEAASAAYWIGSAADELVVTPSGWVGSIGVIMSHVDQSAANEKEGYKVTYMTAGKYKAEFNPDMPLAQESIDWANSAAARLHDEFVKAVARNRGTTPADVRANFGQGRMLYAADAKAAGMVDRIETFEECLARLAGNPTKKRAGAKAAIARRRLEVQRYE